MSSKAVAEKGTAMSKYVEMAAPIAKVCLQGIHAAMPMIVSGSQAAYRIYTYLPMDIIMALVGLILCFCGGLYPTLFAAVEAARMCGWQRTQEAIMDLASQAVKVLNASKKDDDADADGDGVADVNQLTSQALMQRKLAVLAKSCDPRKIDEALVGVYSAWLAVVCTLKIQFARTITLALSISSFMNKPMQQYVAPAIVVLLPADYKVLEKDSKDKDLPESSPAHKWTSVVLGWLCKSVAMSIAWHIQVIICAFTSAVRGGLLCSRSLMAFANKRGIKLGGLLAENDEDTYVDEAVGWVLAALGFYFQYAMGFDVPFPFNIVLMPFEVAEWYIRWTITSE